MKPTTSLDRGLTGPGSGSVAVIATWQYTIDSTLSLLSCSRHLRNSPPPPPLLQQQPPVAHHLDSNLRGRNLQAILAATPSFDAVFNAHAKRRSFQGSKKRAAQAAPSLEDLRKTLDARLRKVKKCCMGKRRLCALHQLCDQPDFIQKVCEWRRSWKMTPRFMRRSALLQHLQRIRTVAQSMRSQQAMQSLPSLLDDAPEESRVCVLQGRDTLMLPHDREIGTLILGAKLLPKGICGTYRREPRPHSEDHEGGQGRGAQGHPSDTKVSSTPPNGRYDMGGGLRLALAKPLCEGYEGFMPARVSHAIPSQDLSLEIGVAALEISPG